MAGNFWAESEIIEKGCSGEAEMPEYATKYSVLKHGEHCTVSAMQMREGFPSHLHQYHDEIVRILEGEGEIVVGDETRKLKKGDVYFVPKGTPHAVRMSCLVLSIFSPAFDTDNPDRVYLE